jgi:hypothetical protein
MIPKNKVTKSIEDAEFEQVAPWKVLVAGTSFASAPCLNDKDELAVPDLERTRLWARFVGGGRVLTW